jgi:hypothetical protein
MFEFSHLFEALFGAVFALAHGSGSLPPLVG